MGNVTPNRKATVQTVPGGGTVSPNFQDSGVTGQNIARPFLGGTASGFHSMPRVGDQVLILHEASAHPVGTVSVTDTPQLLPNLAPGESAILGPDGSYQKWPATGPIVLYANAGGTLSISADPATGKVFIVAAGGLYVNGVAVVVP